MADACVRCGKPARLKCPNCKLFSYCSEVCQKQHYYHGHKGQCDLLTKGAATTQIVTADDPKPLLLSTNNANIPRLYDPNKISKLMSTKPKIMTVDGKGAGLKNVGNTCFVNSVLQSLVYTEPLQVFLRTSEHDSKQCELTKRNIFCMICCMKNLITNLLDTDYQAVVPKQVLLNLNRIGDQFVLGAQEDAHEFNSRVLACMHDAFLYNAADVLKSIKDPATRQSVEETTLIYQLFGGRLLSHVRCTECGHVSKTLETFLDLNLDLSSLAASIEEALTNFCKIEVLPKSDGFKCSTCEKVVAAQKQLTIAQAPNILCIHLKRFDLLKGGIKINKSVAFREVLDLTDISVVSQEALDANPNATYTYSLYAVIVHYGDTIWSGHYVAFVNIDGEWYLFDDDRVHHVNSSIVLKQNAYLLYYKKMPLSTQPRAKSAPNNNSHKPQTPLSSSTELKEQSRAGSAPLFLHKLTPTYQVFYKEEDDVIKFITIKVELPTDDNSSSISVELKGTIFKMHSSKHYLRLDMPVPIDVSGSRITHYPAEKLFVATLGVLADAASDASTHNTAVTIPVKTESERLSSDLEYFNPDCTLDLEPVLDKEDDPEMDERELKFKEGLQKVETINIETNTYRNLLKDLEALELQRKAKQLAQPKLAAPKKAAGKVGPNSPCPCGSGAKYKKCHGK